MEQLDTILKETPDEGEDSNSLTFYNLRGAFSNIYPEEFNSQAVENSIKDSIQSANAQMQEYIKALQQGQNPHKPDTPRITAASLPEIEVDESDFENMPERVRAMQVQSLKTRCREEVESGPLSNANNFLQQMAVFQDTLARGIQDKKLSAEEANEYLSKFSRQLNESLGIEVDHEHDLDSFVVDLPKATKPTTEDDALEEALPQEQENIDFRTKILDMLGEVSPEQMLRFDAMIDEIDSSLTDIERLRLFIEKMREDITASANQTTGEEINVDPAEDTRTFDEWGEALFTERTDDLVSSDLEKDSPYKKIDVAEKYESKIKLFIRDWAKNLVRNDETLLKEIKDKNLDDKQREQVFAFEEKRVASQIKAQWNDIVQKAKDGFYPKDQNQLILGVVALKEKDLIDRIRNPHASPVDESVSKLVDNLYNERYIAVADFLDTMKDILGEDRWLDIGRAALNIPEDKIHTEKDERYIVAQFLKIKFTANQIDEMLLESNEDLETDMDEIDEQLLEFDPSLKDNLETMSIQRKLEALSKMEDEREEQSANLDQTDETGLDVDDMETLFEVQRNSLQLQQERRAEVKTTPSSDLELEDDRPSSKQKAKTRPKSESDLSPVMGEQRRNPQLRFSTNSTPPKIPNAEVIFTVHARPKAQLTQEVDPQTDPALAIGIRTKKAPVTSSNTATTSAVSGAEEPPIQRVFSKDAPASDFPPAFVEKIYELHPKQDWVIKQPDRKSIDIISKAEPTQRCHIEKQGEDLKFEANGKGVGDMLNCVKAYQDTVEKDFDLTYDLAARTEDKAVEVLQKLMEKGIGKEQISSIQVGGKQLEAEELDKLLSKAAAEKTNRRSM